VLSTDSWSRHEYFSVQKSMRDSTSGLGSQRPEGASCGSRVNSSLRLVSSRWRVGIYEAF
jgi:hypothetical protein